MAESGTVSGAKLNNGAQVTVSNAAVQILAANPRRVAALIQNVGAAGNNMRVGIAGVTTTTGLQLVPGAVLRFDEPFVPGEAIFAIREGAADTIALAMEVTVPLGG